MIRTTLSAAVLVGLAATACSAGGPAGSAVKTKSKDVKLALVLGTKGSPFYETMACGAKAAAKRAGARITVSAPDSFDPSLQTPVVNAVTAQHPDAALVVPVDQRAMIPPLRQMKNAGITIVELDQRVADDRLAVSRIASDDAAGGMLAAQTLAKLVGRKGAVLVITAPPGSTAQDARTKAFAQQIRRYPHMTYLGAQYQSNDVAKASSIITSSVTAHTDLVGVFSTNDVGTIGAVTGLKQAGKVGKIKLVGYDAAAAEVGAVRSGAAQALIAQDPYLEGQQGVSQALTSLRGSQPRKAIGTPLVVLTKDDLARLAKYTYKSRC